MYVVVLVGLAVGLLTSIALKPSLGDHEYVKGLAPPLNDMVAEPSLPPLQLTSVTEEIVTTGARFSLIFSL